MPGRETEHAYKKDKWKVALDQGRVSPLSMGVAERGVHDEAVQSQTSGVDPFLQAALKGVYEHVCQLPGKVTAQWHQGHAVGLLLVGLVDHADVIGQPTDAHEGFAGDAYPGNLPKLRRRTRKIRAVHGGWECRLMLLVGRRKFKRK